MTWSVDYKNNPIHPVFTFGQPLSVDLLCPPVQKLNNSSELWEGLHIWIHKTSLWLAFGCPLELISEAEMNTQEYIWKLNGFILLCTQITSKKCTVHSTQFACPIKIVEFSINLTELTWTKLYKLYNWNQIHTYSISVHFKKE